MTPWTVKLLCPLLPPRVWSDLCLLNEWCYLTTLASAAPYSFTLQSFTASVSFPSSHVWIENWTIRKAEHWRIDAFELGLEKTLESPLDSKEIKPVNPKGNQPWIFIGRTVAEAPILWPPDEESPLIGKDPDAGKDGGQEKKQVTQDKKDGITDLMDMSLNKPREIVKDRES